MDITTNEKPDIVIDAEVYKVYAKTDENGIITAVNSSAFLPNVIIEADKWTEIDEGSGDRFHHAQGSYLPKGLTDERGVYNYKLVGGVVTERTAADKQPERDRLDALAEIMSLKAQLAATDYIAAKLAEGAATADEYADELAQRAAWRDRINELEALYG